MIKLVIQFIEYFKERHVLLVFCITFLAFSPLLTNSYVGDDNIIIGRNTFYKSWQNIPRLFQNGYISNSRDINFNSQTKHDFGTGSVSYRPISNLFYFIDGSLLDSKPVGSHLINILIHSLNALLIYLIVSQLFSSSVFALFASLLFSLHPIQSEAVAVMSYRADIIAAMFVLLSFYLWIKFKLGGYVVKKYYYGSLIMCLLALFSKESAVMCPFIIIMFDCFFKSSSVNVRRKAGFYFWFILSLVVYLYIYFIVFPNTSLKFHWLGGGFLNHFLIMGSIWSGYLMNIFLPWTVKLIPGLYCPAVGEISILTTVGMLILIIFFMISIFWLRRSRRELCFFLFWFIIFYLPVSNFIPIANPVACRFMYLPTIGLLIVLAFYLHTFYKSNVFRGKSKHLSLILSLAVFLVCLTKTLFLNDDWKSNYDVGWAWVRDYPMNPRGYALIGKEYFDAGLYEKAKEYLQKSARLGNQIPSDKFALAQCYWKLGDLKSAKALFEEILLHYPDYEDVSVSLIKIRSLINQ